MAEAGANGQPRKGTLLVHIAFHHVPRRWPFLAQVLQAIMAYRLAKIVVVVDSNTRDAAAQLEQLSLPAHCELRLDVHDALPHPFDLTWAHRRDMAAAVGRFDYYMYLEDDIEVPWQAFAAWMAEAPAVERRGFVRGFLRVEHDREGRVLSSDWRSPMTNPAVLSVDGKDYIRPDAFYQACWVCTGTQLQRFVRCAAWSQGFHRWSAVRRGHRGLVLAEFKREFAAFGMSCSWPGRHRILLPLDRTGQVAREAWIHHLPNNYADAKDVQLIGADQLVRGTLRPGRFATHGLGSEAWRWCVHLLRLEPLIARIRHRLRGRRTR